MARKKKTARRRPTAALIARATRAKGGRGNPRAGCRETPFRQRRGFRHYDDITVRTVWEWASVRDADGAALFTQREIADYLGLSVYAVGAMARCMPDGWAP